MSLWSPCMSDTYGPISIGSILPSRFTYVPNLKKKNLSLTEVIVFTRNGLHTYIHTDFFYSIFELFVPKRISVQTFFFYDK